MYVEILKVNSRIIENFKHTPNDMCNVTIWHCICVTCTKVTKPSYTKPDLFTLNVVPIEAAT
jgi:hypothetical protein